MSNSRTDSQGYEHLYEVPIDMLNLSNDAMGALKSVGITNVGECIRVLEAWRDGNSTGGTRLLMRAMWQEIKPKLQELGYWPQDE